MSYSRPRAETTDAWIEIASPTPASHGREYISVEGTYAQLLVDASAGRPRVRSVQIAYADGTQQTIKVARIPALIDVGNRAIDHLVVTTDRRSKGSYTVRGVVTGAVTARR